MTPQSFGPRRLALPIVPSLLALALSGCAAGNFASTDAPTAALTGISGRVHGGQQPVAGALVQLMEPGTTGYGSAPSMIVAAAALTDTNGNFVLPRPYTCPANSGLVYLLATGGNAGAGINSAIAEAAVVGNCSSLQASTFVEITEVTTVAAAYSLAPFATVTAAILSPVTPQSTSIGTSATNLQGLYNAAGSAQNLANNANGFAHAAGDVPGVVPPTNELNTLADILAACVNQGTPNNASGNCTTLFNAARPSGGLTPTDTFQAAVDIAQHPGTNVSTLYGLVATNAPFQPTLNALPNDFSIALGYNGGALTLGAGGVSIAIDATGNAWITSGFYNNAVNSLTEITPAGVYPGGAAVSATSGFDNSIIKQPTGLAIDQSGYIWVCNNYYGDLLKFNPNPAVTLNSTITAASFNGVNDIAFDPAGDAWVNNYGSANVTEINTSNLEASNSPVGAGYGGVGIAIGPRAVWQANYGSNYVFRIDLTTRNVTYTQIGGPIGDVAIDHSNNAWLAVSGNGSVFEISDSGGYVNTPYGGYMVAGAGAQDIAIDGLNNVFVGATTNSGNSPGSLIEYNNSATLLSPGTGFTGSGFIPVVPIPVGGIQVDGSGNVWIAGPNNGTSLPIYVAEVIGIAAPVVTPKATATTNNTLGTRP